MSRLSLERSSYQALSASLSSSLVLLLLALAPVAATLEMHHALGTADYDGHQHSGSDLCQWVQDHASSSIPISLLTIGFFAQLVSHAIANRGRSPSAHFVPIVPPRGPPAS